MLKYLILLFSNNIIIKNRKDLSSKFDFPFNLKITYITIYVVLTYWQDVWYIYVVKIKIFYFLFYGGFGGVWENNGVMIL